MPKKLYSAVTFFLVVFLGLVAHWLVNEWLATHWQQVILAKEFFTPPVENITKKKAAHQQVEVLSISDVVLPPVPMLKAKVTIKEDVRLTTKKHKKVNHSVDKEMNKQHSTSQIYDKLAYENSVDIEIAWPDNIKKREAIFDYLYRCLGMQFGVMSKATVMVVSNTTGQQRSAWLRVAQGELNKQEIIWLHQSTQKGIPVRLFPKTLDWQLSTNIATYLGSKKLTYFRARYGLNKQGLYVYDIWVNEQPVSNFWSLSRTMCG